MAGRLSTERSREFWKRYRVDRKKGTLGEGRYGCVCRAKDRETGDTVAIKKTLMEDMDDGIPSTSMRELSLLRLLDGDPNVVNLRDVFYDYDEETGGRELNLVFDCLSCDLRRYIVQHSGPLPASTARLCQGIYSLHSKGMFHRDLKPQNILLDTTNPEAPDLKIGDLGLGRTHTLPIPNLTHEIGSLHYRAPEILLGAKYYGHSIDIWSVGCIFAELLLRKTLFKGENEFHQLVTIFKILGTPTAATWPTIHSHDDWDRRSFPEFRGNHLKAEFVEGIDTKAFDLLSQLLILDPSERINIVEVLRHPYFEEEEEAKENEPSSAPVSNNAALDQSDN